MSLRIGLMLRNIDERGGAAVYARSMLDALLRIDQDNEYVLAFASEADRQRYGRPRARNIVVEASSKVVWDQMAVPRALVREQVDVAFSLKHSIPLHSFAPRVFIMHGADWIAFPENFYPFDRLYHGLVLPFYLRSADRVITISNDSASRIIAYMPEIAGKLAVVPHGVAPDFRPIADPARRDAVRRRYGLPEHFLLYVGQIYPQKNVAGILKALALLGPVLPHRLVMAGRAHFKAKQDLRLIDELGLADRVHFINWVAQEDLPVLYSLAEILVFPSLYEGFGIPLLEAMACGCPVLTSNAGSCPEVVGEAGLCVDPAAPDAIAAGIRRLTRDEGLADELRSRGFERVRSFTWESAARATLDVLRASAATAPAAEPGGEAVRPMTAVPRSGRLAPEIVAGERASAGLTAAIGLVQRLGAKLAALEDASMAAGAPRGHWFQRLLMSLAGCLLFSLGVKLYIDADLGTDPLHSMIIGATDALDLAYVGIGLGASIVTGAFLVLWSAWNRRPPPLSTFATMALVGYLVDFWNLIGLEHYTAMLAGPTVMMLTGVLLHAYALALIVMSGIGIRVVDLVVVSMVRHWGWSFLRGKLSIEAGFLAVAWLLSGPIGAGSVAFLAVVGCFVPSFISANERLLQLPNYVLSRSAGSHA